MKYYLICNWKMNPTSIKNARALLAAYNKAFTPGKKERWTNKKVVICPPSPYFQLFDEERSANIKLGSQNIFYKSSGPYTGQVSAKMIGDFGVEYVLIGHSDLRRFGDNEAMIELKISEALKSSMTPVVFVGYRDYFKEVQNIINTFSADEINKMIMVYEPRESIGSGEPTSSERVERVIRQIKKLIYGRFKKGLFSRILGLGTRENYIPKPAILYGGSVDVSNYKNYLTIPDLNGFVLGRESFHPENLKQIFDNIDKAQVQK